MIYLFAVSTSVGNIQDVVKIYAVYCNCPMLEIGWRNVVVHDSQDVCRCGVCWGWLLGFVQFTQL